MLRTRSRAVFTLAAVATLVAATAWAAEAHRAAGSGAFETTVYFLVADGTAPIGVRRTLRDAGEPLGSVERGAIDALLAGPTPDERAQGLRSALPASARLVTLNSSGPGATEAVLDFSGLPPDGANAVVKVRVITQVTRTLVGLAGIERVRIRDEGRPWGLWKMEGGILDEAYDYGDLLGFYGICTAKPNTETVVDECFTALP